MNELVIIIVSYNTREYLDACLRSLQTARIQCLPQIVVVDNGSSDGSVDLVRTKLAGSPSDRARGEPWLCGGEQSGDQSNHERPGPAPQQRHRRPVRGRRRPGATDAHRA